jgi:cobalamin synthase
MARQRGWLAKYSWALIVLAVSLIILWFVLDWLHRTFGSNIVGQFAGTVGELGTGQKYTFQ